MSLHVCIGHPSSHSLIPNPIHGFLGHGHLLEIFNRERFPMFQFHIKTANQFIHRECFFPRLPWICHISVWSLVTTKIRALHVQCKDISTRLVPRFQKGSRSWVRWVQGLGPWWILDLACPFCRETLETQDLKIVLCRKTLETQHLKILIYSETLKTQDLKIVIVARPWKPRTLKFGYVAKPWKPRTQNLKILMYRDLKDLGPYTIQYRISCWALCQGVQQVMNSDDRAPKTWILKNNTTYRTHPAGGRL